MKARTSTKAEKLHHIHDLLIKTCRRFIGSVFVKYEPILTKIGAHVREENLNLTVHKVPISREICARLRWEM